MSIDQTTKIIRNPGTLATNVDKDMIILNMATNHYVALDEIGQRIWDLIENPTQVSAVCAQLASEYSGDAEQINADVLAFLSELVDESLAHLVEA